MSRATAKAGSASRVASVTIVVEDGGGDGGSIDAGDFLTAGAQWVYQHESNDSIHGKSTVTLTVDIEGDDPGIVINEKLEFRSEPPPDDEDDLVGLAVDDTEADDGFEVTVLIKTFAKVSAGELLIERTEMKMLSGPEQVLVTESHMQFTPSPKVELLYMAPGTSRDAQWRQQGEVTMYGPVCEDENADECEWGKRFTIDVDADVTAKLEVLNTAADGVIVPVGGFPNALRVDHKSTFTMTGMGDEPETFTDELSNWYDPLVGLVRTTITSSQYQGVEFLDEGPLYLDLVSYTLP